MTTTIMPIRPAILVRRLQSLRKDNAYMLNAKSCFDELWFIDKKAFRAMMSHWQKTGELSARFYLLHTEQQPHKDTQSCQ